MSGKSQEVHNRVNKLEYAARANVTTVAQTLEEIYTGMTADAKKNLKELEVHPVGADIFYGTTDAVTSTDGGGVIKADTSKKFNLLDVTESPYFVAAGANVDTGLTMWG